MKKYIDSSEVFAVENKLKKLDYYPTPNQLWKEMKGKFKSKAELGTIIEYFLNANKLILNNHKLVWIENPKLDKLLSKRGFVVL